MSDESSSQLKSEPLIGRAVDGLHGDTVRALSLMSDRFDFVFVDPSVPISLHVIQHIKPFKH